LKNPFFALQILRKQKKTGLPISGQAVARIERTLLPNFYMLLW